MTPTPLVRQLIYSSKGPCGTPLSVTNLRLCFSQITLTRFLYPLFCLFCRFVSPPCSPRINLSSSLFVVVLCVTEWPPKTDTFDLVRSHLIPRLFPKAALDDAVPHRRRPPKRTLRAPIRPAPPSLAERTQNVLLFGFRVLEAGRRRSPVSPPGARNAPRLRCPISSLSEESGDPSQRSQEGHAADRGCGGLSRPF